MALFIKQWTTKGINETLHHSFPEVSWHVGEILPKIEKGTRVVTFQADGEELEVILMALRGTRGKFLGEERLEKEEPWWVK